MKFSIVVFLSLMALTMGHEISQPMADMERSISSQVVDAIYAFREQMPCGFPGLGLGPLSPAYTAHQEFNISAGSFDLACEINDFNFYNLDNFDVLEFKVNLLQRLVTFSFQWFDMHFETLYKALFRTKSGMRMEMERSGNAKFGMKNLKIWGTIRYSLGILSGKLQLREFKVYVSVDEVVSEIENLSSIRILNKMFNDIIAETVYLAINDNTDNIADLTDAFLVPLGNTFIGDRTLTDLIGMISGGGDSGSGDDVTKAPCVPPTHKELFA